MSPEANRQKATVQVKVQILNPAIPTYIASDMNATVKFLADETRAATKDLAASSSRPPPMRDHDGKKVVYIASMAKAV